MTAQSKAALVTGGTGAIGRVLVEKLVNQGYETRALVRHERSSDSLPKCVRIFRGEITDTHALNAAATGVEVVFHLAARLHINDPEPKLLGEYNRVNIQGTRSVVGTAQAVGARRVIFFSTIAVYGPSRSGQILDETSPLNPDSFYAETKVRAEEIVLGGSIGVVLRLGAVYGPHMKGNYPRLLSAIRHSRFVPIGPGTNRRTLVYDQDAADAALLAAAHPGAVGKIYNVTDGHIYEFKNIVAAIYEALGKRPPRYHLPAAPVRLLAGMVGDACHLFGKISPISKSAVDKLTEDMAVRGEKIQTELGFRPRVDLTTGWQRVINHSTK